MVNSDRSIGSIVGDLINFRGLVYAPINENGVIFLFGKVAEDLNMYVEEIKPGFPDCIARRFTGRGWERVRVEFEYASSNFQKHGHDPKKCDVLICWEHDWKDCPLEVIELKDRIKEMENRPIKRPDESGPKMEKPDIDSWFDKHHVQDISQALFKKLLDYVTSINEGNFYKVGERFVSFYCPERMFLYLSPRKTVLRIDIFTAGQPLGKVKQFEFEKGGQKWGAISITNEAELEEALPWMKESYERIRRAIANNEPTSYYARLEETPEESEE